MRYRSVIVAAGFTLASALAVQAAPLAPAVFAPGAASAKGAGSSTSPGSSTFADGEGLLHLAQWGGGGGVRGTAPRGGQAFRGGARGPASGFAGPRVRAPSSGVYRSAPRAYRAPVYGAPRYRGPVYRAPVYGAPRYRGPVYRAPVYGAPAYRASPRVRRAPPVHVQRYRYHRPGFTYHHGGYWYPFAWWTQHYSPYFHYTPAPVYRARPRVSSRCAQWHRQCVARWGYNNPNYYGCMRYHRC